MMLKEVPKYILMKNGKPDRDIKTHRGAIHKSDLQKQTDLSF
jgi:hypothetical protein